LKLVQPADPSDDSDSSSGITLGSYRRTRQCSRSIKESERNYSALNLEALLCLLVGVSARLSASITTLRFDDDPGRVARETLRMLNGALKPLSESFSLLIIPLSFVLAGHRYARNVNDGEDMYA
jgi:hypothetical protein